LECGAAATAFRLWFILERCKFQNKQAGSCSNASPPPPLVPVPHELKAEGGGCCHRTPRSTVTYVCERERPALILKCLADFVNFRLLQIVEEGQGKRMRAGHSVMGRACRTPSNSCRPAASEWGQQYRHTQCRVLPFPSRSSLVAPAQSVRGAEGRKQTN